MLCNISLTWLRSALSLWIGLATMPAALAAGVPPVEDFMRLPAVISVAISPSGNKLAMAVPTVGGGVQLAMLSLMPRGEIKAITGFQDADVADIRWVNDDRLVFRARRLDESGERADAGVYAINADGSGSRELIARRWSNDETASRVKSRVLTWQWDIFTTVDDGSADIVVSETLFDAKEDERGVMLSRLNTVTGEKHSLSEGVPNGTTDWLLDDKGVPRVVSSQLDGKRTVYWRQDTEKPWAPVAEFLVKDFNGFSPSYVDAQGQIYVETARGRDTNALYRFDPVKKELEKDPVVGLQGFDLNPSFETDPSTHQLVGLHFKMEQPASYWFDKDLRKLQQGIDAALPEGRSNKLLCGRCSLTRFFVVESGSDQQPGEYYLFDRTTLKLERISSSRPWLIEADQGHRSFHRVAARDGLSLPVYLTRPAAAPSNKPLPAVVLVHGGPYLRGHDLLWDQDPQFLASRGYLVIEVDFRGSTGYGSKHFRAGWKQWGQAMQDDLADATAWAVKQGFVDPQRVCIVGASYGGYAALMGPIRSPGVYQCAVSYAGVTDIGLLYSISWSDTSESWKRYGMPTLVGDPKEDADMLAAVSPIQQVSRIKVPVLLAIGAQDRRVPADHGRKFRAAAEKAGVPVEWVVYAEEGHGLALLADRIDFWTRVDKFLTLHIGASAAH